MTCHLPLSPLAWLRVVLVCLRHRLRHPQFSPEELQFCSVLATALVVSPMASFDTQRPVPFGYFPRSAADPLRRLESPPVRWPPTSATPGGDVPVSAPVSQQQQQQQQEAPAAVGDAKPETCFVGISEHALPLWKRSWVALVYVKASLLPMQAQCMCQLCSIVWNCPHVHGVRKKLCSRTTSRLSVPLLTTTPLFSGRNEL